MHDARIGASLRAEASISFATKSYEAGLQRPLRQGVSSGHRLEYSISKGAPLLGHVPPTRRCATSAGAQRLRKFEADFDTSKGSSRGRVRRARGG